MSDFDPSRAAEQLSILEEFVAESNRIEGIRHTTGKHIDAHIDFLDRPLSIPSLIELVNHLQPDARFRNQPQVPGVCVGNHVAPPSGPDIETGVRRILAMREPWAQHVAYETIHPFTDGNGRSGRAIWLHRHFHEELDPYAIRRGFLHSFYYQTLANTRLRDSGRHAEREDPEGLRPKAARTAPVEAHRPNPQNLKPGHS